MKKLIAICLVLTMALGFAACGKAPAEASGNTAPLTALENIWAQYGDDEKFALMGGNPEAGIMDAPGQFDLADKEALAYFLQQNAELMEEVEEAATMIHMMNANSFTGAALKLTEGADMAAFVEAARENVQNAQWMCGFPDQLIIANVDGLVVMAYGVSDLMSVYEGHLTAAYAGAEILVNEAIAG